MAQLFSAILFDACLSNSIILRVFDKKVDRCHCWAHFWVSKPFNANICVAHAHSPHRLVLLELYHHLPIPNHSPFSVPHLLDEPPSAYLRGLVRPNSSHSQPSPPPRRGPYARLLDLSSPVVQLRSHTLTEATTSDTKHEGNKLRRCLDQVWLSRRWLFERVEGRSGAFGC